MKWLRWTGFGVGLTAAAGLGLAVFGNSRWRAATQTQIALLEAARMPVHGARYDAREIESLPAPVQRYFRAVLKDGQLLIAAATFRFAGTINMSATGENWRPFTSWQQAVVSRPGFLWNGSISIPAGLVVHVHDSYIAGTGRLHAAVQGLFTVADVQGGGEIARGEMMRYFAEMVWYPTALLPSQGVRWEAMDDRSAKATLTDGSVEVTLLFSFDEAGLTTTIHADARGAVVGKEMVMLPWDCSMSNYQLRHGMLVPTRGEVGKGGKSYFVGDLVSLDYEFSP